MQMFVEFSRGILCEPGSRYQTALKAVSHCLEKHRRVSVLPKQTLGYFSVKSWLQRVLPLRMSTQMYIGLMRTKTSKSLHHFWGGLHKIKICYFERRNEVDVCVPLDALTVTKDGRFFVSFPYIPSGETMKPRTAGALLPVLGKQGNKSSKTGHSAVITSACTV